MYYYTYNINRYIFTINLYDLKKETKLADMVPIQYLHIVVLVCSITSFRYPRLCILCAIFVCLPTAV